MVRIVTDFGINPSPSPSPPPPKKKKWITIINFYLRKSTDVRSTDDVVIEILKHKVPDERAPDCDVVKDGPVSRVHGDLYGNNHHQDGSYHATDEHVIRHGLPLQRSAVKVSTCKSWVVSVGHFFVRLGKRPVFTVSRFHGFMVSRWRKCFSPFIVLLRAIDFFF